MGRVIRHNGVARSVLLLMGLSALPVSGVCASAAHLVLDINQTHGSGTATGDSNPADFVDFDGGLVFTADDGVHGRELWQSDGTAAGTRMIADVNPGAAGSNPHDLMTASGVLYFFASDATGTSHLMSLAAGTATPVTLAALSTSSCSQPAVLKGRAFFVVSSDPPNASAPTELWTSDGTSGGTVRVDDPQSATPLSPCNLTVASDTLYLSGAGNTIWTSDGTREGTRQFATSPIDVQDMYVTDGVVYFNGGVYPAVSSGIYRTDGTAAGTYQVLPSHPPTADGFNSLTLIGINNGRPVIADSGSSGAQGTWSRLDWTDGTLGNIVMIYGSIGGPVLISDPRMYFTGVASDGGTEPFVTEGTVESTHVASDIVPGGQETISWFADFAGRPFISLFNSSAGGQQLWQTDGTYDSTHLISDIPPEPVYSSSQPVRTQGVGGQNFFFVAHDAAAGNELYVYEDQAPVAVDDHLGANPGAPVPLSILSNDSDPDGTLDPGSVKIISPPSHGTVVVGADDAVTYTSTKDYIGTDSFTYTVADKLGKVSGVATVQVDVSLPVALPLPHGTSDGGGGALRVRDLLLLLAVLVLSVRYSVKKVNDARLE